MERPLTEKQEQILSFIINKIENAGYPPSIREIGRAVKVSTLRGVTVHLDALEKKGYIRRTHQARGIQVLGRPETPGGKGAEPAGAIRLPEGKRPSGLLEKVAEISGENLFSCYQCGKCSAGCPLAEEMDFLPHQVIRFLQLGVEDPRFAKTIWLCASCLTCVSRCPRGVDLSRVMAALRETILRREGDRVKPEEVSPETLKESPPIALVSNFRKFTG